MVVYVLEQTNASPQVFSDIKKAKEIAREIRNRFNLIEPIESNECFFYSDSYFVTITKVEIQ